MASLTKEQKDVVTKTYKDITSRKEQIVKIGGIAGSGKSTISKVLLDALANKGLNFHPCAYTGKATDVLRKKGMNSNTIHGTIYQPYINEKKETVWCLANRSKIIADGIDGFLVDEASMVTKDIHEDLVSFGLPIIYVGDHGQLEPIGTYFNLMQNPTYKLETVHRNAGEIAHFANHLRQGHYATEFKGLTKVQIVKESAVQDRHLATTDQIICAFNKTRVKINERVRTEKKIQYTYLAKGERVICLRNNRKQGLFNGQQGIVQKVHKDEKFDLLSDGVYYEQISYDPDQFGLEKNEFTFEQSANPFDYGYCVTCHKMQGSEANNVIVYEQRCEKWDHVRWSYTAASRAKKGLVWIGVEEYLPYYL